MRRWIFVALCYVMVEFWRFCRFRSRVRALGNCKINKMSRTHDHAKHRRFIADLIQSELYPIKNISGWFQSRSLTEIPRDAAVAALKFYLSCEENSTDAAVDREAKAALQSWQQRDDRLRQLDEGVTHWDPEDERGVQFSRIGRGSPITAYFKPLPVQAAICCARLYLCHWTLRREGFHRSTSPCGLVFWTRHCRRDVAGREPPLFFLHGAGAGTSFSLARALSLSDPTAYL